jgi:hypothetical protein
VAPHGNIFLTKGEAESGTLAVNASMGNILPQSRRVFDAAWSDGFPVYTEQVEGGRVITDARGDSKKTLQWKFNQADKLRFGKYTAHLTMVYDDGTKDVPVEATTTFWVIPWRLALGAIALPVVPALLMYAFMKWRMRRVMRRAVT